jgi:hypothetical protein
MLPQLRSQEQFVENEITAIQAALPGSFQFGIGSIMLAITESHGRTAVWEQSLVQFVLAQTRLSTSTGTSADTFVEDFGYSRPQGNPASGEVTFSSFTPTSQRLILASAIVNGVPDPNGKGAIVTAAVGGTKYTVVVDTTNPAYNGGLGGYVIAPSVPSVTVPIICNVNGTVGNAASNSITTIFSSIVGVDTVTNAVALDNGVNPNTDTQLRANFVLYLQSLNRATFGALEFALQSVPGIAEFILVENVNYTTGDPEFGQFWAVIDDGTGNASGALLAEALAQLNAYRGYTIQAAVYAPMIINPTVAATIYFPSPFTSADFPTLLPSIATALQTYANLIPFGETFFYTRISQIIYNQIALSVPSELFPQFNVSGILLDGGTADVTSTQKQRFILLSGDITLTPNPS